jgi:hypothetical protein
MYLRIKINFNQILYAFEYSFLIFHFVFTQILSGLSAVADRQALRGITILIE